jgi:1-acyl-sn-glycerol-3-phosphate acyltransferase
MLFNLEKGPYHSPAKKTNFLYKTFPSFFFYCHLFSIVFRASRKAKRGIYTDEEWAKSSLESLRALEKVGIIVSISGFENVLSREGPCIFVGNHMSTLETFLLPNIILPYKRHTFVIKESLVTYPVFKHVMRSRDPICVSRTNPREDLKITLQEGKQKLNNGISIVIFPQTTRTTEFDPNQFNSIGIKVAKKAGVPVVPVAIKSDAWGNGTGFLKDYGKIDPSKKVFFEFGEPLIIKGNGQEEHEQVVSFITQKLELWQNTESE